MTEFLFDEKPFDIVSPDQGSNKDTARGTQLFVSDLIKETGKIRVEILKMQKRLQAGGPSTGTQTGTPSTQETIPDANLPKILKYIDQVIREIRLIKPELTELKEDYEEKIVKDSALELMPVADAFLRVFEAMKNMENDPSMKGWIDGIHHVHNSLMRWFRQKGIEEIECVGKMFDPRIHAAISTAKDPSKPNDMIAHVEKRGFMRRGVILRYPEVIIVKNQ